MKFRDVVLVAYVVVGMLIDARAARGLRDQTKIHLYPVLYSPELFTPEGNRWKRISVAFWFGGLFFLLAWWFLW